MEMRRLLLKLTVILCFGLVPSANFLAAQVIPAVTGRVVDAVTGESIPGISLTLQISSYEGFSVHTKVNSAATSDHSGRFSLSGVSHLAEFPSGQLRAYWLTVNEGLNASGQEEDSAGTQILYNPMSNRRGFAVADPQYFPSTITFAHGRCGRGWLACIYETSWSDIVISLIPVLQDVNDCKKITDASMQEKCRQLNTYRAAFVHVDSYQEVKNGKELCTQVDGGAISKICLSQLESYVANPAYERPIKLQVNEPIPEGMFPDSLAEVSVMKNRHCGPRLEFSGRVMCSAGYGSETKELVAVYIEEWPEEERSAKPPVWKPNYTEHKEATVTVESRLGGNLLRYRGPQYNSFYWYSGDRHIEVVFYYPIPQVEQFVSYYLAKFPSNFH